MAFTIEDFRDLIQLLGQHPEWRTELRRWVLSDDLLALPQTMHDLAEAQRRTEERVGQLATHMDGLGQHMDQLTTRVDGLAQRMDQLTTRVDGLAQHMDQLTTRVDGLAQHMDQLTTRMAELTTRVDELARRMDQLTARMDQLIEVQSRMGSDLERLKGSDLERRYRERAHASFSRLLQRLHVLSGDELMALLGAAVTQQQLSEDEADDILQADVVLSGRRREDGTEAYAVVEVSWGIGLSDVQCAARRATLLARTGTPTLPVVAGFWLTPEAQEPARAFKVWQVTNGRLTSPETA
jgi:outer membrane murein-binding lipoprotein Lpp